MKLSENTAQILQETVEYARENNYEYVTPEMLLLFIMQDETFAEAFYYCGGDGTILASQLNAYISDYIEKTQGKEPELSAGLNFVLAFAGQSAYSSGNEEINVRHLVHAIWNLDESYAKYYLEQQLSEADLLQEMANIEDAAGEEDGYEMPFGNEEMSDGEGGHPSGHRNQEDNWKLYAPCLNDTLKDVNPLIGRQAELERTIQILCRKDKNNPLHIGEPGVGKTAITYGLVELLKKDEVPDAIKGAKVFALDLGGMLAGTQYRGDFEKRFKKVLSEIGKEERPIIYIDEIHNLSGAGAVGEGSFDASNMLKPYLSDGHIRFIGATTFEEYKKYFEKNKSLIRRFQNVEIKEPTEEESVKILEGLREKYETYHGVKYDKGVLEYAVKMSSKYINERFLPDKAIDIIDEAGSYRKLHMLKGKTQTVDKDVINEILTKICRVPIETVETDDMAGLATLEERLKKLIFGQDEAVSQVVNAVKFSKAGLIEDGKPLASLLFVGPTGVGKTEIARCLAKELGSKLIRFDMSEYGEKHAVAKLIGSPAGYVGYEEGGILTEAIRKSPSSVLLLDEIEKAHPDIFNVLLQVMDYATLTDNQGRKADFRNVIVIMTSNAGANKLGKSGIGFVSEKQDNGALMDAVKQTFQPEFRNRLTKIVAFNSMDEEVARLVVDKKLSEMALQLKARNITVKADKKAKELVKVRGISQEFGAREVDRVIRNDIKPLFVDDILFGSLKNGGNITITVRDGEFSITTAGR
ncbi:AAA family ATPase [Butyrivibrio sp. FCS014]|uniref:AAA family ATPase n=1 Tax=Butyrivibrio sp. FCS014 TaxID=1408304 RepID=UPI00046398DB|nr:AAA family ATPase [Butyrivibrio sp. FCS014]